MTEPRVTFLRGHESVNVAGESHYQDALRAISGQGEIRHDTEARLIPEPDNPHDANAVRVEIDGAKVGYLPRDLRRNGHHRWPSWRAGGGSAPARPPWSDRRTALWGCSYACPIRQTPDASMMWRVGSKAYLWPETGPAAGRPSPRP